MNLFTKAPARTIFSLAFCLIPALAQNQRKPIFITPEQLNLSAILPNPPADDSPQGKAELAEVHHLQERRLPAQIAHAKADDAEEDMFIFRHIVGDKFTTENLPATARLSSHLHNDEGIMVNPAKSFFHKYRPFNLDATVMPVCKTNSNVKDYGYPSGHATTGYLEALALIQILPEMRDAILARADDYAYSRVVCGVHYPSDGHASKLAAYSMMSIIVNNPQFKQELEAARVEVRNAINH
jgi:acid phosphatase (class A)